MMLKLVRVLILGFLFIANTNLFGSSCTGVFSKAKVLIVGMAFESNEPREGNRIALDRYYKHALESSETNHEGYTLLSAESATTASILLAQNPEIQAVVIDIAGNFNVPEPHSGFDNLRTLLEETGARKIVFLSNVPVMFQHAKLKALAIRDAQYIFEKKDLLPYELKDLLDVLLRVHP